MSTWTPPGPRPAAERAGQDAVLAEGSARGAPTDRHGQARAPLAPRPLAATAQPRPDGSVQSRNRKRASGTVAAQPARRWEPGASRGDLGRAACASQGASERERAGAPGRCGNGGFLQELACLPAHQLHDDSRAHAWWLWEQGSVQCRREPTSGWHGFTSAWRPWERSLEFVTCERSKQG